MLRFTLRRLLIAALVALVVSAMSFGLMFLSGDPAFAIAGEGATEADLEVIRRHFGFDRPIPVQYAAWVTGVFAGDFGDSYYFSKPVVSLLAERFPATLKLGGLAILVALALSIPLAMLAAVRQNQLPDRLALGLGTIGQATPSFWLGLMLIWLFAVKLRWLPVSGSQTWAHFVLPAIVLGYYAAPSMLRLCRAGMIEALQSDYVRTARAKGMLPRQVLFGHAIRNAILPVVSVAAVEFGFILGGSVVVESVFGIRGIGLLAWESISRNDFPTIQAIILIYAMIYVWLTFLADVINAWLDPRIRVS
ncbi:MAG: ABC transporter permease [Desulfomicrobium sp.]|uniref:ABC transporter permease n=1 Tax=Hoeflea sp. TaxID=1940281 RepID=UPI0025C29978|nr:ABC transporter permease [Hoeflea sp.]MBU4527151.1 ABC transporter permease [Alphaproteobacteria bacterium]MBV1713921.1 ABC transporter permease [Desulfomicrobium sp.]MBU4544133.1 ABC transporter permease [Alphaproteobacteria bacterium]MBU4552333.1 ABC transporter permease [Alphaproteobacteria bacterium]MBV1786206.1 ABC transporter permease [Hoeflea sp.]